MRQVREVGIAPRPFSLPVLFDHFYESVADLDGLCVTWARKSSIPIALPVTIEASVCFVVAMDESHSDFILFNPVKVVKCYQPLGLRFVCKTFHNELVIGFLQRKVLSRTLLLLDLFLLAEAAVAEDDHGRAMVTANLTSFLVVPMRAVHTRLVWLWFHIMSDWFCERASDQARPLFCGWCYRARTLRGSNS